MQTVTIRPRPATEPCPVCNGRGYEFFECPGGWPHEVAGAAAGGAGTVDTTPEPATFGPDPDIDGLVSAFWDAPRDAEDEGLRRACRDRWGAHAAAFRSW